MKTSTAAVTILESHGAFGGRLIRFAHESAACKCTMKCGVFVPPERAEKFPVLYCLGGLTASDVNWATKVSTAQQAASDLGVMLVFPDTSPREGAPDAEHPLLGYGASYYVDATEEPYATNYQMCTYVTTELPSVIEANFPADSSRRSICGHSMGGHGALVCYLRAPYGYYASCSAFAPVSNPSAIPLPAPAWRAFAAYLGGGGDAADEDAPWRSAWRAYDACELVKTYDKGPIKIKVDQGKDDPKLEVLGPRRLVPAADANKLVELDYSERDGYDHELAHFVASFAADHVKYHAAFLSSS